MIIKSSTSNFITFSAEIDLINDLQENVKKQLADMGYKDLNPKDYLNTYFNIKKEKSSQHRVAYTNQMSFVVQRAMNPHSKRLKSISLTVMI